MGTATSDARRFVRDFLEEIRRTDTRRVDGICRDAVLVRRVLQSVAQNMATEAAVSVIAADAGGNTGLLHPETVQSYLNSFQRVFAIEDQPAWSAHLRSRSRLRRSPKRHFVDPSLAVAALRSGPNQLRADLGSFGLFFESLAVRDLRVYARAHNAEVYHHRDNTKYPSCKRSARPLRLGCLGGGGGALLACQSYSSGRHARIARRCRLSPTRAHHFVPAGSQPVRALMRVIANS